MKPRELESGFDIIGQGKVKVITSEECVPKHKPLVMDMRFKATKRRRRKFEPRVRVRKLKEEKT